MNAARINKIKGTAGNAFNVNRFAFEGENELKYDKGAFFWVSLQSLDLSFNA